MLKKSIKFSLIYSKLSSFEKRIKLKKQLAFAQVFLLLQNSRALIEMIVTIFVFNHCCCPSVFTRDIALHSPHPLLILLLTLLLMVKYGASHDKKGYIFVVAVDLGSLVSGPLGLLPCIFLFSLPCMCLMFLKMISTFPSINRNKAYIAISDQIIKYGYFDFISLISLHHDFLLHKHERRKHIVSAPQVVLKKLNFPRDWIFPLPSLTNFYNFTAI